MEDRENLQRLDDLVAKLLNGYKDLQEENKKLSNDLHASQLEVAQLEEKVSGLLQEKNHVHEKVAGILDAVEHWENAANDKQDDIAQPSSDEVGQKEIESSSQLFSMES